ncbi:MAG: hypothetical protein WCT37_03405 [Patescibacteria group bacterium]|jgi:hypothetical protein
MKKILLMSGFGLIALFLAGCSLNDVNSNDPLGVTIDPNQNLNQPIVNENKEVVKPRIPETKEDCLQKGGSWKQWGIAPVESCNLSTTDGGKVCTDFSQCQGTCLGENIKSIEGKCTDWVRTGGCQSILKNGKIENIICSD